MTTTTQGTRFGPVREIHAECVACDDKGIVPAMDGGADWVICGKCEDNPPVVAYEAHILVRCPECDKWRGRANDDDFPCDTDPKCPRCADSPEPGWVVQECGDCADGTRCRHSDGIVGADSCAREGRECEPYTCPSCNGAGKATVRMSRERFSEIMNIALTLLVGHEVFDGNVWPGEATFALHIAESEAP